MGCLTLSNVDNALEARLRERAARHGRSVEAEALAVLREGVEDGGVETPQHLGSAIRDLFRDAGGVALEIPARDPMRTPPTFD